MKRIALLALVLMFSTLALFADDVVDPGQSNQWIATQGFEQNELDALISPLGSGMFAENPTLFFALDATASQFGADILGDGFRGGWGGSLGGLPATAVLNYLNLGDYISEPATENTTFDGTNYDDVTGLYATVVRAVNVTEYEKDSEQRAIAHLGADIGIPFALQLLWTQDRFKRETLTYSDDYVDAPLNLSAGTLNLKNDRTHEVFNLIDGQNAVILEPEIGLRTDALESRIALAVGLVNVLGPAAYEQTVTQYDLGFGVDDTLTDRTTVQTNDGWYYWNGGAVAPVFTMNTAVVNDTYAPHLMFNVAADNKLMDFADGTLEIPASVMYNLYLGDRQTIDTNVQTDYDDSVAAGPQIVTIDTVTTTTTLGSVLDVGGEVGARYRRTFEAGEAVLVHLGAGLMIDGSYQSVTKSQEEVTAVQDDGDGDGLFDNVATDTDEVSRLYGYSVEASELAATASVDIPLAVSYHPVPLLEFHAGTTTTMEFSWTGRTSLVTGDAGFTSEQFTDNLDDVNNFTDAPAAGTNAERTPSKDSVYGFSFSTSSSFGITLHISDSVKVDAIGTGFAGAGLDAFSLTAIWSR
jgi:hypothetical protein